MLDPTFNGDNILETRQLELARARRAGGQQAIDDAKLVTDPAERAQAWADVNKAIMAQAPSIPYMWDYQADRRLAERARRAERLQHDLGPELHLDQVGPAPLHPAGRPAASRGGPAGRILRELTHGPLHHPPPRRHGAAADPRQRGHLRHLQRLPVDRPGGAARRPAADARGDRADPRRTSGSTGPLYVQFGDYIWNVFAHQDFGHSYVTNVDVLDQIREQPAGDDLAHDRRRRSSG